MSDPLGRHYCKYATNQNDINSWVYCMFFGTKTNCAGMSEECVNEEEVSNPRRKK